MTVSVGVLSLIIDAEDAELGHVRDLAVVTADFSHIKRALIPTEYGKDGLLYYKISYQVEITHYSAYTKYELIYNGVNYGPIKAEYV